MLLPFVFLNTAIFFSNFLSLILSVSMNNINMMNSPPIILSLISLFGNFLRVVIIYLSNYYIEFTFLQRTKQNNDKVRIENVHSHQ